MRIGLRKWLCRKGTRGTVRPSKSRTLRGRTIAHWLCNPLFRLGGALRTTSGTGVDPRFERIISRRSILVAFVSCPSFLRLGCRPTCVCPRVVCTTPQRNIFSRSFCALLSRDRSAVSVTAGSGRRCGCRRRCGAGWSRPSHSLAFPLPPPSWRPPVRPRRVKKNLATSYRAVTCCFHRTLNMYSGVIE